MTASAETLKLVAPDTEASTAAAMPVLPTTRRQWAGAGVLASMRKMFLTSTPDTRAPRRDYPRRYGFLEQASMSREMDRL